MSELNAAWGLALLPDVNKIINQKKKAYYCYLKNLNPKKFNIINKNHNNNYNYVPVKISSGKLREKIVVILNNNNIFPENTFIQA